MFSVYRQIILKKPHNDNNAPQLVDLLQLSRREQESRHDCRRKLREFQEWRKVPNSHVVKLMPMHRRVESMLRRRQVQDAILFYRLVQMHRIHAFQTYIDKLPVKDMFNGGAR